MLIVENNVTDMVHVEVDNYIRPLLSPQCTCVDIGRPANIHCRLLLAGIKEGNKCSPFTLCRPNDIIYFAAFKHEYCEKAEACRVIGH